MRRVAILTVTAILAAGLLGCTPGATPGSGGSVSPGSQSAPGSQAVPGGY
jgi:hypothetical protein